VTEARRVTAACLKFGTEDPIERRRDAHSEGMTQIHHDTDHLLAAAVVDELAWTPSVIAHGVSVAANRGVVTLSGDVDSYPQKQQAVRAALRVLG